MANPTTFVEHVKEYSRTKRFRAFGKEKTKRLYDEAKSVCYNFTQYKWRITLLKNLVKKNNLEPSATADYLKFLFDSYHIHFKPESKRDIQFARQVRESPDFRPAFAGKIRLKGLDHRSKFLEAMKEVKGSLKITDVDYIKFIHQNFETGWTEGTLGLRYKETKQ